MAHLESKITVNLIVVCRERLLLFEMFFSVLPKRLHFLQSGVSSGGVFYWQLHTYIFYVF